MDHYQNFNELATHESAFDIICFDRNSRVTILAPHGGRIEPNSDQIARLIAAKDYNLFCFNGLKPEDNRCLHLTSHRFDHPRALALVNRSAIVITVHGCSIIEPVVHIGGLDTALIRETNHQLRSINIGSSGGIRRYAGIDPDNICNRGLRKKGMQLEISRPLRDSPEAHQQIAAAVRAAIVEKKYGRG